MSRRGRRTTDLTPEERRRFAEALAARGLAAKRTRIPPRDDAAPVPLSRAQQRLWFLEQLLPGTCAYNDVYGIRLRGTLDVARLERCLEALCRRHDSLRTTFGEHGGRPCLVVGEAPPVTLDVVEVVPGGGPSEDGPAEVRRLAREGAAEPFDLARGPLLRGCVYRLAPDDHVLVLWMHHIVSDGQSFMIFFRELGALYAAADEAGAALPALAVSYADYAAWEQARDAEGPAAEDVAYWKARLTPPPPELALPFDHPRGAMQTFEGDGVDWLLDDDLAEALGELGRRHRASLFMVVLAAFEVLLARACGREDFLVGSPFAERDRPETEPLFGLLVNTLVLRADLSGDPSFSELLARTRQSCLDAYRHRNVPFDRLVQEIGGRRDLARNPLFQVFALQDTLPGSLELPGLRMEHFPADNGRVRVDLALWIMDAGGLAGATGASEEVSLRFQFNTALFERTTVESLMADLRAILRAVADDSSRRLGEIGDRLAAERREASALRRRRALSGSLKNLRRRVPVERPGGTGGGESP